MVPGAMFADHRIESSCSEGSMAHLYRVQGPGGEPRILKVPRSGFGSHPACLAGFETETEILRRLDGRAAPRLVARGTAAGQPWLICEDLGEDSLANRLDQLPLPVAEVMKIGAAVANALADLHRQGIVNHDLKPAHIRFRPDGTVALIDFGLSRHAAFPDFVADEAGDRQLLLGTPAYVAPEQADGRRGDPRSDLYSLGAILYRLVTGDFPYGTSASLTAIALRRYYDCRPPRQLNRGCPAVLQQIILRCLEPDPAARYGSAAQLAADLRYPEQVVVGERGERLRRRFSLPFHRLHEAIERIVARAATDGGKVQLAAPDAPQIMVALDIAHGEAALADALRVTVRRMVGATPRCRVICVYALAGVDAVAMEDADGLAEGMRSEFLMALRHWAAPLNLSPERLRCVVLRGDDAAQAILEYAESHHIDQLVIGARGHSSFRRLIGSVSAKLAAEAPCSVCVVRNI